MLPREPIASLPTHEVKNTPPHMGDQDLWLDDIVLREGVEREGGRWAEEKLAKFGILVGSSDVFEKAHLSNKYSPELKAFDRYGMRINEVTYHSAYHELMGIAVENEVPSLAWKHSGPGGHVGHTALTYMMNQSDAGVMCSMAMTYAAIPSLRTTPVVGDEWIPRLMSTSYDPRDIPLEEKTGATVGMFMTEKQGGSDVRANSTKAIPTGQVTGPGGEYFLTGHKFFCSAPMSDAFLTLAYSAGGLSCFLVPRWTPDGVRNSLSIQKIKGKLGNRSNASTEIELQDTWGMMVGDEGQGVQTIIEMVQYNRFYCCSGSSAIMRQSLVQALHHVKYRSAFRKKLIQQPLMSNVIADLALESEAALALTLRLGRSIDEASEDSTAAALFRIGTAIGKYWICKRAPAFIGEALECLGGSGYIEDSMMPRLYREAPLNSIWEGSGNIMCLDVLRAIRREEMVMPALFAELDAAKGANKILDAASESLKNDLLDRANLEIRARDLTERMAVVWQAALLVQAAPAAVADAFCHSRLGSMWSGAYGTLPVGTDFGGIIDRAIPSW